MSLILVLPVFNLKVFFFVSILHRSEGNSTTSISIWSDALPILFVLDMGQVYAHHEDGKGKKRNNMKGTRCTVHSKWNIESIPNSKCSVSMVSPLFFVFFSRFLSFYFVLLLNISHLCGVFFCWNNWKVNRKYCWCLLYNNNQPTLGVPFKMFQFANVMLVSFFSLICEIDRKGVNENEGSLININSKLGKEFPLYGHRK